jgi:hypothetical protein
LTEILNFYFCHPLAAINPKNLAKLAKSALKQWKKTEKYATPNTKSQKSLGLVAYLQGFYLVQTPKKNCD